MPQQHVVATAANHVVVASAAEQDVIADPSTDDERSPAGADGGGVDDVVAGLAQNAHRVERRFERMNADAGRQAGDQKIAAWKCCRDDVVVGSAVDDHEIRCRIAGAAADHGSEAGVDVDQVGSSQVVNREGVDSTQRVEVEVLDVVEVQGHRADVAGEADAGAGGRDVEDFADVGAIEDHAVIAVLAFDRVVTVARVPLEGVVTGTEEHGIVALIAIDEVVVVAAEQNIGSVAAQDGVITGSAIDGDLNQRGEGPSRGKGAIAAGGVEEQDFA